MFQHVRSPPFTYYHDYEKRTVLDVEEQLKESLGSEYHARSKSRFLF